MVPHYGPKRAEEILRGLKSNDVQIAAANSDSVKMVCNGLADVALSDSDDVFSFQREGMPVAFNFLRQGDTGPLVFPCTAAVIKGAPHPAEAAELMKFLLSAATEDALLRSDSHNTPIRSTSVPADCVKYLVPVADSLPVNYADIADQLDQASDKAAEILH